MPTLESYLDSSCVQVKLSEHPVRSLGLAFQQINRSQYVSLVGFHNESIHDHLIQQEMDLLELVHNVQFANGTSPLIHGFYKRVDELQHSHLILIVFGTLPGINVGLGPDDEEKAGVPPVDHLESTVFQKGALQLGPGQAFADDFRFQGHPLLHGHPLIIGGQAGLPLLVSGREGGGQTIVDRGFVSGNVD